MRVCSSGLPALAGVLLVAPSSTVRPVGAHMRHGCILDSNGLTKGNVRETAVGTAVPNVAADCSQGTAELGNRAPELAEDAPRCMPSRGSLLEALVQLGNTRRWLPWSCARSAQVTAVGLGGFESRAARRGRSCRPEESTPSLGTGVLNNLPVRLVLGAACTEPLSASNLAVKDTRRRYAESRATAPGEPKCWRLPGVSWPRQRTTEASQPFAQIPRTEFRAAVGFDVSGRCPNTSPNLPFRRRVYTNTLTGVSRGPKKAHGKCPGAPRRLIRRRSIFFHCALE